MHLRVARRGVGDLLGLPELHALEHVAVDVGQPRDLSRLPHAELDDVLRMLEIGGGAGGDAVLRHRIEREHVTAGRDRLDAADDRRELDVARAAVVGVEVQPGAVGRPAQVDRIAVEVAADLAHVAGAAGDRDDVHVADRVRVSGRRVAGERDRAAIGRDHRLAPLARLRHELANRAGGDVGDDRSATSRTACRRRATGCRRTRSTCCRASSRSTRRRAVHPRRRSTCRSSADARVPPSAGTTNRWVKPSSR